MGIDPFHQQVASHWSYLFRYAMVLCRRRDYAEDLVQETMMRALAARDTFDDNNLPAWLTTILANYFRTQWRRRGREQLGVDDKMIEDIAADLPEPDNDPAKLLARLFAGMDEADHPLLLALAEGDTYAKLALRFDVPEGTIKSRVSRLRTKARELLGVTQLFEGRLIHRVPKKRQPYPPHWHIKQAVARQG